MTIIVSDAFGLNDRFNVIYSSTKTNPKRIPFNQMSFLIDDIDTVSTLYFDVDFSKPLRTLTVNQVVLGTTDQVSVYEFKDTRKISNFIQFSNRLLITLILNSLAASGNFSIIEGNKRLYGQLAGSLRNSLDVQKQTAIKTVKNIFGPGTFN